MFITVQGKKIHYRMKGVGPAILFVHGWGGSIESLEPLSLQFKSFTSITLDLPGFGKSDLPEPIWAVEEYSKVIIQLCEKLQIKDIVYFGHSFGGSLGIYIAAHYPSLIQKLILCDSSFKRSIQKSSPITTFIKKLPLPPGVLMFIKKIAYRIFLTRSDSMKYPAIESNFRKIISYDLTPLLSSIHIPTLILWGKLDIDTPLDLAYELKEKITKSSLVVFPDATHSLPLKYPKEVYQKVAKFL